MFVDGIGPLLLTLPWWGVLAFVFFRIRIPSELPMPDGVSREPPLVSVIVPARNEVCNIEACVRSLTDSEYPNFEVIVVDDRSEDATASIARSVGVGKARRLDVLEGAPLPHGWLGKPWACWQGARVASGDLLLFTDADTRHGPLLLSRAVAGLRQERADLLTLVGRQIMETFWERLVQPQIFMFMLFRFADFERAAKNARWRDAIANGQFLLFRRKAYDAIGGHAAVRDEVVEDMALAQRVKRSGLELRIRAAETDLATRMYRSFGTLVAGWSKNIFTGGMQSVAPRLRPLVAPLSVATSVGLWLVPPAALVVASSGAGGLPLLHWSALACGLSVVVWGRFTRQMGGPRAYGLLYPLGASVSVLIVIRSWIRGRHVEWKGRRYELPPASGRP